MAQKQQSITESMFGLSLPITPEFGGQMPIEKFRGSTPMGNITESYRQAGQSLQGSVRRLFGQQTPQEATVQKTVEQEKDIREAILTFQASNPSIDMNTPEALKKLANHAVTINPDLRMFSIQLNQRADALQSTLAAKQRKTIMEDAELDKLKAETKNLLNPKSGIKLAQSFQQAASALEYPIYGTIQEYTIDQRKEMEKYLRKKGITTAAAAKQSLKEEKREMRQDQKIKAASTTVQNLNDVIDRLENEKTEGKLSSAGLGGQLFSWIGGTDFKDLAENLKTIKANIGFDQLAFLKEASETGGALGQVSNFELENLQAVRGSIDQTQSPEQLLRNIKRVKETYSDYLRSVYNNPKVNQEVKARIGNLMGRFDIRDRERKTEASQLILKYNDSNAKILIDSFRRAMINLRKDRGSSVVNQELNNKQYTTTDVLKTVERKLIKEGRIKTKGK